MKIYVGLIMLLLMLGFLIMPSARFSSNASASQKGQSGQVAPAAVGVVITVDTNVDNFIGDCTVPGNCTLRAAIDRANGLAGADSIQFQLPIGATTINLLEPLDFITDPVTIDGTTQPGFAGTPIVEINGQSNPGNGLEILANGTIVKGLVINRFDGNGILLATDGCVISGNYIGTAPDGVTASPNTGIGVLVGAGPGL